MGSGQIISVSVLMSCVVMYRYGGWEWDGPRGVPEGRPHHRYSAGEPEWTPCPHGTVRRLLPRRRHRGPHHPWWVLPKLQPPGEWVWY